MGIHKNLHKGFPGKLGTITLLICFGHHCCSLWFHQLKVWSTLKVSLKGKKCAPSIVSGIENLDVIFQPVVDVKITLQQVYTYALSWSKSTPDNVALLDRVSLLFTSGLGISIGGAIWVLWLYMTYSNMIPLDPRNDNKRVLNLSIKVLNVIGSNFRSLCLITSSVSSCFLVQEL